MDDSPEVFHHFVTTVVALLILEQHSRYPEAHFLVVLFCFTDSDSFGASVPELKIGNRILLTNSKQPLHSNHAFRYRCL